MLMSESKNLQVLLKNRPQGEPKLSDFALVENSIPEIKDGELLSRTIYLSLDPYMRGRISAKESYADPVELDSVMVGATVSQVVRSNLPQFSQGDFILDYNGWQTYGVSNGKGIRKLDHRTSSTFLCIGSYGNARANSLLCAFRYRTTAGG